MTATLNLLMQPARPLASEIGIVHMELKSVPRFEWRARQAAELQIREVDRMGRVLTTIAAMLFAAILVGCGDGAGPGANSNAMPAKVDFSTPEGAILCLEAAYRAGDIEAAVRCKDFRIEARLMFQKLSKLPSDQVDDELIAKTAEVLELAYRKQFENGFPDMVGVVATFPRKERFQEDIFVVTEVCYYPDGGTSTQRILVAKTDAGWRVLNPVD